MIKLITQCRNVATVFTLLFAFVFGISQLSQTVDAQESFDSYPQLELQSGLELPELLEELSVPEDLNVLTRGQLHEAFASAHQANPEPSALVLKTPPELIDEVPPEYKPDGNHVQWISGYWAWDDAQSDFIWISGIWRDVPPNRRWIPGYWDAEGNGYHWISGIWAEGEQLELGYLPQPPASIDQGPAMPPPGEEFFYVPGNWAQLDGNYRWFAGHWQPLVENWIWIPASYVWTPNGCVYQSGYWDYEIQNRGTCFAPVQFVQPVYLAENYNYCPSYAIDLNVDFLTHLFVRPNCDHYFYGDWYASNFNNVRYRPWVSYRSHFGNYDPLLAYYGHRRSSSDSRFNVVQYLTRQHNFYVNNRDYRPRPTYRSQYKHAKDFKDLRASGRSNFRGQRRPHEDYLSKSSYVRTFKEFRTHDDGRHKQTVNSRDQGNQHIGFRKHHKVAEKELRDTRRNVEQLAKVQRERKRQELSGRHLFGSQIVTLKPSSNVQNRHSPQNSALTRQLEQQRLNRARERASRVTTDAERRQRQVARSTIRTLTNTDRNRDRRTVDPTGDTTRQRSTQPELRTRPNRNAQQELVRLAGQQQIRQQRDRELARRSAQQVQASRTQNDQARRAEQDRTRRNEQQDQARRAQRDQDRRVQQDSARRDQERARRTQQDQSRKAQQKSQQDRARRAQQDRVRRSQQAAVKRAKQDQDRRDQQKAQQQRSRKQAAQRAEQQQSQRDAAKRDQQKSKRDAAKRAQQKTQQEAAKRAQVKRQKTQQEAAKRAQEKRQKSAKKKRSKSSK